MFREPITLASGDELSVQAGQHLYTVPRLDGAEAYTNVEVGNIDKIALPITWYPYIESGADFGELQVYPYIPAQLVYDFIQEEGGYVSGELPPLRLDNGTIF